MCLLIPFKMIMLLLVLFLVACALGAGFTKNLLVSIIIFMSYSLVMSVVWIFLSAPDLAITEAAVGAGVTSVLFFATLRRINAIDARDRKEDRHEPDTK